MAMIKSCYDSWYLAKPVVLAGILLASVLVLCTVLTEVSNFLKKRQPGFVLVRSRKVLEVIRNIEIEVSNSAKLGPGMVFVSLLSPALSAFLLGSDRKPTLIISSGLHSALKANSGAAKSLIRHEMGHIKNRDLNDTSFMLWIWISQTAILTGVLTCCIFRMARISALGDSLFFFTLFVHLLVTLLALFLFTRTTQVRERYADLVAVSNDSDGAFFSELLSNVHSAGSTGFLRLHPPRLERISGLIDPSGLFRIPLGPTIATGVLIGYLLSVISSEFSKISVPMMLEFVRDDSQIDANSFSTYTALLVLSCAYILPTIFLMGAFVSTILRTGVLWHYENYSRAEYFSFGALGPAVILGGSLHFLPGVYGLSQLHGTAPEVAIIKFGGAVLLPMSFASLCFAFMCFWLRRVGRSWHWKLEKQRSFVFNFFSTIILSIPFFVLVQVTANVGGLSMAPMFNESVSFESMIIIQAYYIQQVLSAAFIVSPFGMVAIGLLISIPVLGVLLRHRSSRMVSDAQGTLSTPALNAADGTGSRVLRSLLYHVVFGIFAGLSFSILHFLFFFLDLSGSVDPGQFSFGARYYASTNLFTSRFYLISQTTVLGLIVGLVTFLLSTRLSWYNSAMAVMAYVLALEIYALILDWPQFSMFLIATSVWNTLVFASFGIAIVGVPLKVLVRRLCVPATRSSKSRL